MSNPQNSIVPTVTNPDRPPAINLNLVIETPENVLLKYQLAGPSVRFYAFVIDLIARRAILIGVAIGLSMIGLGAIAPGLYVGLLLLLSFVIDWGYYVISEGFFRGKTFGKHLYNLRTIQEEGYPITLRAALLRNIIRAVDSIPFYGVGFICMLVTGKFRRLGDLVARTVVIEESRVALPREPVILEKIHPLSRNDLGGYLPTPQTLTLIENFLSRRHVLTHRRGHEMAYVLAHVLAERLSFRGDSNLVERYPMAFLARVYATYFRPSEEDSSPTRGATASSKLLAVSGEKIGEVAR